MIQNHRQCGATLIEALIALTLFAVLSGAFAPQLVDMHRKVALDSLARRTGSMLARARARAILDRRFTALVVEPDGTGGWNAYLAVDGDGDGVHRDDLQSGVDRGVTTPVSLVDGPAAPGFPALAVPDPANPSRPLAIDDPIRGGSGDIFSFNPQGSSTAGSIYLTDGIRARVVRVLGLSGRVRGLEWRPGDQQWRSVGR